MKHRDFSNEPVALTVTEVARRIGKTDDGVRRWWKTWDLPMWRSGKRLVCDSTDLDRWVQDRKAEAAERAGSRS